VSDRVRLCDGVKDKPPIMAWRRRQREYGELTEDARRFEFSYTYRMGLRGTLTLVELQTVTELTFGGVFRKISCYTGSRVERVQKSENGKDFKDRRNAHRVPVIV
jgi:hypothetical protein